MPFTLSSIFPILLSSNLEYFFLCSVVQTTHLGVCFLDKHKSELFSHNCYKLFMSTYAIWPNFLKVFWLSSILNVFYLFIFLRNTIDQLTVQQLLKLTIISDKLNWININSSNIVVWRNSTAKTLYAFFQISLN